MAKLIENRIIALVCSLAALVLIAGCTAPATATPAPQATAAPTTVTKAPATVAPTAATKAPATTAPKPSAAATTKPADDWQKTWDETVAAAKKEGILTTYTLQGPEQRAAIAQGFKARFGIEIESTPFQRGAEMQTKLIAERTAGLNLVDFFGVGGNTPIVLLKPERLTGPLEPLLILPEVKDPKYWTNNQFPWIDRDRHAAALIMNLDPGFLYNTDLVKKGEITSYYDLLKPQYKGKMILNDPTLGGASSVMFNFLVHHVMGEAGTKDYLGKLVKDQATVVERDYRIHVESVARGKYAIGIGPHPVTMTEFIRAGAPIDVAVPKEGSIITYGTGALSVPVKSPHPNATKVFVNWILTKEGQDVVAKSFGQPAMRKDATTEGILPIYLPQPGEKLVYEGEEDTVYRGNVLMGLLKGVIDAANK